MLSLVQAHSLCLVLAGAFVLSLYVIPSRVRRMPRDEPEHIRYRMITMLLVTIGSFIAMYLFPLRIAGASFVESVGLSLHAVVPKLFAAVCLMSIFYAGPITTALALFLAKTRVIMDCRGKFLRHREVPIPFHLVLIESLGEYWGESGFLVFLRNIIAAPIAEELVFRGLMVCVLTAGYSSIVDENGVHKYSPFSVMIRVPLWFALAHVHHLIERLRSGAGVVAALVNTLFQFTYTSIFGFIAACMLMRTGSIYAPIASHVFCNFWGLPNVSFLYPSDQFASTELSFLYSYRYFLLAMHAGGLLLFALVLQQVTSSFVNESVFYKAFQ